MPIINNTKAIWGLSVLAIVSGAILLVLFKSREIKSNIFEEHVDQYTSFDDVHREINNVSAEELAKEYFERGDYRYAAIRGIIVMAPDASRKHLDAHGYKIIARTGDALTVSREQYFQTDAKKFAIKYNLTLNALHAERDARDHIGD